EASKVWKMAEGFRTRSGRNMWAFGRDFGETCSFWGLPLGLIGCGRNVSKSALKEPERTERVLSRILGGKAVIVITAQPERPTEYVDHRTPESHWCGSCRSWVVDCDHLVTPLPVHHVEVADGWIKSLSCERRTGGLEIHFTWNDVRQFWP